MEMNFKLKWESFLNGFDSIEEMNLWDKEAFGEMEAYCENILLSFLVRFISSDGVIKHSEVEKLNTLFGFDFSLSEIVEIAENITVEQNDITDNIKNTLSMITKVNSSIAEDFKTLLIDACDVIINSDNSLQDIEIISIKKFIHELG